MTDTLGTPELALSARRGLHDLRLEDRVGAAPVGVFGVRQRLGRPIALAVDRDAVGVVLQSIESGGPAEPVGERIAPLREVDLRTTADRIDMRILTAKVCTLLGSRGPDRASVGHNV